MFLCVIHAILRSACIKWEWCRCVKWILFLEYYCRYETSILTLYLTIMWMFLFFFPLESTVLLSVVDCGLVTSSRESSYRSSEYLMQLWDENKAWPQYRCGERGEKRASHLGTFLFPVLFPRWADKRSKFPFCASFILSWSGVAAWRLS